MIQFEDVSGLAQKAVDSLLSKKDHLNLPDLSIRQLADFSAAQTSTLETADRELICDQAILMIDQLYPHLPFKRARYAIDPVQRIRLLRAKLDQFQDERYFHSELIKTFAQMRDVHTSYRRPPPYAGSIAFLPFLLESYTDEQHRRRFVVTSVLDGFDHPSFVPGVEVTHWNGMPVLRAVELLADHIPGGNPAARFVRGMMRITVRSLASTLPPDEEMVFVRYRPDPDHASADAPDNVIAMPWFAGQGLGNKLLDSALAESATPLTAVCEPLQDLATVRKVLWARREWTDEQRKSLPSYQEPLQSLLPKIFQFHYAGSKFDPGLSVIDPTPLADPGGKCFGYIKIKTFEGNPDEIFTEFTRILGLMSAAAPDGLILDVRGNAGGSIRAAERMLQTLTPREIIPAKFHFANTPPMQNLMAQLQQLFLQRQQPGRLTREQREQLDGVLPFFRDWFTDELEALSSGNLLTSGRPITNAMHTNDTGQVYYGPVTLLIDAASYSATDTFAAGFQDHEVGEIIGVDENTGGGGATLWKHSEDLVKKLQGLVSMQPGLQALPAGVSMTVALQRSARVGSNAGDAVEDIGVRCDVFQPMTRNDLMCGSPDLIAFACKRLAARPVLALTIVSSAASAGGLTVKVESIGIDRLVCSLDGHPQTVVNATDQPFTVPLAGFDVKAVKELRVDGYTWVDNGPQGKVLRLAASARTDISPA